MAKNQTPGGIEQDGDGAKTFIMDATTFGKLQGEKFAGLRILALEKGQAAGPFVLTKILEKQNLTPEGSKKKMAPVDVYVATDPDGLEIRMPIAASFIGKAQDANLAEGDTFAVLRTEDYTPKGYKTVAKGFQITVISRAGKAKK